VAVNADMNINIDGTTVPISSALFGTAAFGSKFFPIPVLALSENRSTAWCVSRSGPASPWVSEQVSSRCPLHPMVISIMWH